MRWEQVVGGLMTVAGGMWLGTAAAQSIEDYAELWSDPNEFYLFEFTDSQAFEFRSPREVRVCAKTMQPHENLPPDEELQEPVGLEVEVDSGETMMVEPGDCAEFQAQRIVISPSGAVASGWALHGTIETAEPRQAGSQQG